MTEQLELEGTNLCISEDAFEKFQASSMYEESECIILPSSGPTHSAQSDCGDDTKVTCSDDVVALNLDEDVNTQRESESENPPKVESAKTFNDDVITCLPSEDVNSTNQTLINRKKRGRKKKSVPGSSDPLSGNESECVSMLDYSNGASESIEDIQNFIQNTSPTYTPNRRGRRPKSSNTSSDDFSPSKRRLSKESITESSVTTELCNTENSLPRRRGRPRKIRPSWSEMENSAVNNVSPSHADDVLLIDSTEQDPSNNTSDTPKQIIKKRGRPRKTSFQEQQIDVEIVDTTDEQLDSLKSLPDVSKGLLNTKKARKRGRPRKPRNSETEQTKKEKNEEPIVSPLKGSSNSDDEDLSLSNLSKLVHKNQDSNTPPVNEQHEHEENSKLETNEIHEHNETKCPDSVEVKHSESSPLIKAQPEQNSCDDGIHKDNSKEDESQSTFNKLFDTNNATDIEKNENDTPNSEIIGVSHENKTGKVDKNEQLQSPPKRNPKVPIMSDFEYNIDSIVNENIQSEKVDSPKTDTNSLLVEDVSKRPTRKKGRQTIQYHDESDEDPFANMELSDDEPIMRRKGRRYNSDDEYFPIENNYSTKPTSSDSESNPDLESDKKSRKRKYSKKSDSQSPRKRGRKSNLEKAAETEKSMDKKFNMLKDSELVKDTDDDCIETSGTHASDKTTKLMTNKTDIESYLAKKIQGTNLKIKKVSPTENADKIAPLEIPIIDPNEPKKVVENSTQTNIISTSNVDTQTGCPYHFPMKDNVALTVLQSTKACEFLNSIVATTADLGKLMTQKSEDFIKKKINTENVTNSVKMDYCVKKSFLLFKLAKNNLEQMEKDLATQYEQFLSTHDLLKHREEPKTISPKVKDSDSDCEIVEESVPEKGPKKSAPKFNPKTVFLNKELSIKIAKKADDKNINIKKHTVWINDSVMVKKVKPTQSFLAQDSRNKKPPDQNYITTKMVSDFFEDYYRKKSLATCSLFTSPTWLNVNRKYVCHYFVVSTDFANSNNIETEDYHINNASSSTSTPNSGQSLDSVINKFNKCERPSPETLFTLCTEKLQKQLHISKSQLYTYCNSIPHEAADKKPKSLVDLCINIFSQIMRAYQNDTDSKNDIHHTVLSLKTLCYLKVSELLYNSAEANQVVQKLQHNKPRCNIVDEYSVYHEQGDRKIKTLLTLCLDCIQVARQTPNKCITHSVINKNEKNMKSLFSLCVEFFRVKSNGNNNSIIYPSIKQNGRDMKELVSLCFELTPQEMANLDKNNVNPTIVSSSEGDNSAVSLYAESELIDNNQITNIASERAIKSLFSLCLEFINLKISNTNKYTMCPELKHRREIKSLFSLAFDSVRHGIVISDKLTKNPAIKNHEQNPKSLLSLCVESLNFGNYGVTEHSPHSMVKRRKRTVKSLFSICVENIQRIQISNTKTESIQRMPNSLQHICFKIIHDLLYSNGYATTNKPETHETLFINNELAEAFTINSVNTLSEEAFHNLQNTVDDEYDGYDNEDNYFNNDDFVSTYEDTEAENNTEGNDWAAQVRMKELKSCANINNTVDTNREGFENFNIAIKAEPIDDVHENEHESSISVKIEPVHGLDEMTMIPEIVFTKTERPADSQINDNFHNCADNASRTYSVDTFEEFVRRNKLIQALNEDSYNEVYTQSSFRIRQQYEPDYDGQNDVHDGLLIPHAYTNIYSAKDCLMASSSDEANSSKNVGKKKSSKRKAKPKKNTNPPSVETPSKDTPNKETPSKDTPLSAKEKSSPKTSEVDELTKKMKDRIRQEEKDIPSSDSEYEELPLSVRRKKTVTREDSKKSLDPKPNNNVIQCNDVDSTEQLSNVQESVISNDDTNSSSSNSVVQNDLSKSRVDKKSKRKKRSDSAAEFNGPMELLECEPTIQEYDEDINGSTKKPNHEPVSISETVNDDASKEETTDVAFHERDGWSCYAINTKDAKLYQNASVVLEKLPESFVQTYFQYQEIGEKNPIDREIDRLTNVNSLNRILKEKVNNKPRKVALQVENNKPIPTETLAPSSPEREDFNTSEQFHELAPSDDEEANVEDEVPPVIPMRHGENNIAKNSLMNDESEPEDAVPDIKQESVDETPVKRRPGPKSKTKVEGPKIPDSELVLTADKMMKEELTLLHAPATFNDHVVKTESVPKEDCNKTRKAIPRKVKQHVKSEEDSSSEEEKQWVTTKEKLLKKMKNKQDASLCDAKRAKMVSEFIEKRGVGSESRKVTRGKGRGSRKKFLEREKQLQVLSQELYGASSSDAAHPRKSYFSSNYNGRRNIRKVIDKKSLKQSTVKAIMEEFERKRRLNERQNRLREHLGCDENVNVLVINDEVCLEYDFEEDRPIVTVHQFFTKVMKAHQYEGVKFMWDACFESVSRVAAGQGGAGCILAHCMGLGKTLQVLALLHTVLTHPGVNMKRVLVCCPLSTVLNWVDEIHKWIGPVTDQLKVFELSKLKKTYERAYQLEDWYNGGGIFIIGYELFRSLTTLDPTLDDVRPTIVNKIRTALLDPGPDIVVCDEGHLLKNDCSVLAVAMSRVATRRRIVLTGTPMQNNLREYYCMVNFIKPNLLGSYPEYSNRFANPIMNGQHRDSSEEDIKLMKTRTHILHKVLEGCLQRQEASVLYPYLPKKHEYTVFIPLTKCQWDLYKHYLYTYCKHNKQSILKDFHILQKIWTHPQVLHNFQTQLSHYKKAKEEKLEDDLAQEDLAADDIKPSDTEVWWLQHLDGGAMLDSLESSNKFVAVFRILKECVELGDKVLIFSTSLFCLDSLEFFLKQINKWSLGQEYYRLDGSVPAEVRHKWCREFNAENNEKTKLFLISTRAGCLGLNMTAANRVIILDTSWNPAHDIQSIFRVYRFGQKKDCFIYRLVAMGTMEQKIYERSVTKQAVACRVVDEQQIDRHYNSADLAELYRLDEAGGSVAGGVAAGVRDVALLRVARDGPVHAVHEHDSLLRASEPALPEHERAAAWHQFQMERAAEQNFNEPQAKKAKITTKSIQKKEEKPNTEAEPLPPEPGPSKPVKEETSPPETPNATLSSENDLKKYIVDRVVHNLIKHDLPNMRNLKETSDIVKIVRHIVSSVPANEENKDRVSLVITENLLKHIKVAIPNIRNSLHKNNSENEEAATKATEKPQKPILLPQKQSKRLQEKHMQLRSGKQCNEVAAEEQIDIVEEEETLVSEKEIPTGNLKVENAKCKLKKPESHELEAPIVNLDKQTTNSKEKKAHKNVEIEVPVQNLDLKENTSHKQNKIYKAYKKDIPMVNLDLDDSNNEQKKTCKVRKTESPRVSQDSESNIQSKKTDTVHKEIISVVQDIPADYIESDKIVTSNEVEIELVEEIAPEVPEPLKIIKKAETKAKKPEHKVEQPVVTDNSILLSDDDEVCVVQSSEPTASQSQSGSKSRTRGKRNQITKPTETDEPVPLHPSLLSNKNFITIVAYRYLEDNPMLDEHAATLAARYSTLKARREIQYTGKSITSGPLYDIAMKVLGIQTLKKLQNVNNKVSSSKTIVEVEAALRLEESVYTLGKGIEDRKQRDLASKTSPAPSTAPSTSKKSSSTTVEKSVTRAPAAGANVVPVELFKGPSMPGSSRYPRQDAEECILPDDDTQKSQNQDESVEPASVEDTAKSQQNQKANPMLLQRLLSSKSLPPIVAKTSNNAQNTSTTATNINSANSDMTICLDSDEEDPPPTPATTASIGPVPVALTSVTAQAMPITSVTSGIHPTTSQPKLEALNKVNTNADGKTAGLQQRKPLILKITSKYQLPVIETESTSKSDTVTLDNSKKIKLLYVTEKAKKDVLSESELNSQSTKTTETLKHDAPVVSRRISVTQVQSKPAKPSSSFTKNDIDNILKKLIHVNSPKKTAKTPQEVKASYGFNKTASKVVSVIDTRASTSAKSIPVSSILANKKALLEAASTSTSNTDKIAVKEAAKVKVDSQKTKEGKSRSSFFDKGSTLMIDLTSTSSSSKRSEAKRETRKRNYRESPENCVIVESPPVPAALTKTVREIKEAKAAKSKTSTKTKSSDSRPSSSTSTKDRKRPSTSTEPEPTKKKRLDELTLQDFDIDDLDDIIELE